MTTRQERYDQAALTRRKGRRTKAWDVILGLNILWLLAAFIMSIYLRFQGEEVTIPEPNQFRLLQNALIVLTGLAAVPLLHTYYTRRHGSHAIKKIFKLDEKLNKQSLLYIGGSLLILFAVLILFSIILQLLGFNSRNEFTNDVFSVITIPIAIAIALSAGLGEELFFRGWLQHHTNIHTQAIIFGLLHAVTATTITGILFPIIAGYVFGYIVYKTNNLKITIISHALFNLIQYLIGIASQ